MEELKCSVCGSVVNPGDSFCQNCGSPVEAPAVENVPEAPVMPEAPTMPEAPEVSAQQETTVLSGNPFSMDPSTQNASPQVNPMPNQTPAPEMSGTYQQPPVSDINYQGTYSGNYSAPTYTQTVAPAQKPSKGLGIAALILGILGLLTSCCYGGLLLGLIAIILGIMALVKKKGKVPGGIGLATGIIGFIISLVIAIITAVSGTSIMTILQSEMGGNTPIIDDFSDNDDYYYDGDNDYSDIIDDLLNDIDSDTGSNAISVEPSSLVTATNQIMVDGIVYTLPMTMDSLGFSVSDVAYNEGVVSDIETNGLTDDYEFVVLETESGTTFWGYIENTSYDPIYNVGDLLVTGINVDNYSGENCTAYSCQVYGGVTLWMSRSEVETLIGTCDSVDANGQECYNNEGAEGRIMLRIEYDEYDTVCALDVTVYPN